MIKLIKIAVISSLLFQVTAFANQNQCPAVSSMKMGMDNYWFAGGWRSTTPAQTIPNNSYLFQYALLKGATANNNNAFKTVICNYADNLGHQVFMQSAPGGMTFAPSSQSKNNWHMATNFSVCTSSERAACSYNIGYPHL